MSDSVTELVDPAELMAEIGRLRGEVARLNRRVEQLDLLAHRDALIDLPNRRGFMRELDRIIARFERSQMPSAMLYVDLDGLKMINDTFGHQAGDEALVEVARQLTRGVRRSDIVARIGGDEFAILLENCDEGRARETAARLTDLIGDCDFRHEGESMPLSVAIGVAIVRDGDTATTIMDRADEEMYQQKAA